MTAAVTTLADGTMTAGAMSTQFLRFAQGLAEELVTAAEASRGWQSSEMSDAIQSFRKRAKLLRATLAVLAQGVDRPICEGALEILGEANRLLSPLRDHDVLRRSIRWTGELFEEPEQRSVRTVLSAALLLESKRGACDGLIDDRAFEDAVLSRVMTASHQIRTAVAAISGHGVRRRAIASSIEAKWKQARRNLNAAIVARDAAALHAVRKDLVEVSGCLDAWGGGAEVNERCARFMRLLARVARKLGEDRDFAMLSDRCVLQRDRFACQSLYTAIVSAITMRRKELFRSIRRDARRLRAYRRTDLRTMLREGLS